MFSPIVAGRSAQAYEKPASVFVLVGVANPSTALSGYFSFPQSYTIWLSTIRYFIPELEFTAILTAPT